MGRFPTAGHLASWAGLCPGNHESAGKRQGGKTRQGHTWRRRARTAQVGRTALADQYRRLVVRRGQLQAAVAVGHRIPTLAYAVVQRGEDDCARAPVALDERRRAQARRRAVRQRRQLGSEVTRTPKEAVA